MDLEVREGVEGVLFRCVERAYGHFDEDGDSYGTSSIVINTLKFPILGKTPKGTWIYDWMEARKRFVLGTARKQYASPTEREALEQLRFRKIRHAAILRARVQEVGRAIWEIDLKLRGLGL